MYVKVIFWTLGFMAIGLFLNGIIKTFFEVNDLHDTQERWRVFYKNTYLKIILLLIFAMMLVEIIFGDVPQKRYYYEPLPSRNNSVREFGEGDKEIDLGHFDYNEFKNEKNLFGTDNDSDDRLH